MDSITYSEELFAAKLAADTEDTVKALTAWNLDAFVEERARLRRDSHEAEPRLRAARHVGGETRELVPRPAEWSEDGFQIVLVLSWD